MSARRTWVALSLGIFVLGLLSVGFITTGMCFPPVDPRPAQAIMLGVPTVAFLVLAYLALAERRLRWRVPELALSVVLILPAFALGGVLALLLVGVCPGGVPMPWDTSLPLGDYRTGGPPLQPTPWPSDMPLQLTDETYSSPVAREYSTDAEVSLRTLPGATCAIGLRYHGAKTPVTDLEPKTAASPIGWVYWGWTIPKTAPLGPATFTVTCSRDDKTVTWSASMDVRQAVSPAPT